MKHLKSVNASQGHNNDNENTQHILYTWSGHRESNLTIVHQDATLFRWVKYIYFIHLPMKIELIEGSETSAIRTQTQRNYPKENILHIEHSES